MAKSFLWLSGAMATLLAAATLAQSPTTPLSGPMIHVPGGNFRMGDESPNAREKERPAHSVTVKPFLIGKFEVSVGQFRRFVDATGYRTEAEIDPVKTGCVTFDLSDAWVRAGHTWREPGYKQTDNFPVTCLTFKDAQTFISWLNDKTHGHFRLPSESEWEYAARAGSTTIYPWGSDPNAACLYANGADQTPWPNGGTWKSRLQCNDHHFYAARVGSYRPNAFGIYDMIGNEWEWVQDCWHETYEGAPTDGSAWEQGDCRARASRGGSWHSSLGLSAFGREWNEATSDRFGNQGFRLAADL